MYNRAFSDDDSTDSEENQADDSSTLDGDTTDAGAEPEYNFAGFNIDFSVKVQLTPPSLKDTPPGQGRVQP